MNDATRETGGTLGVAVIGSVYTSLYVSQLAAGARDLPRSALEIAKSSVGAGYGVARGAPAPVRDHLLADVQGAFLTGLHAGCYVAAGVCALGLAIALALPGAPPTTVLAPAAPAIEERTRMITTTSGQASSNPSTSLASLADRPLVEVVSPATPRPP